MAASAPGESVHSPHLFAGGGELSARLRAVDWARHPLGDPAGWPLELRLCLRLMLASPQPLWVWWGPEFYSFHNEACQRLLGARPEAVLGQPAPQAWPALWPALGPPAASALRAGAGVLAAVHLEDAHLTCSFTPIPNATGSPIGLLGALADETQRVQLERRLAEKTHAAQAQAEQLRAETARRARAEQAAQEVLARLVGAQEAERQRVAHELHDSLGRHLTALHLGLQTVLADAACPPAVVEKLQRLRSLALRIDDVVEYLVFELRPPVLDDLGLGSALQTLADEWSAASGLPVDRHLAGLEGERLPEALETTVYRIAQEALTNIAKHAAATQVSLIVERRDHELLLIIEDNGRGFDLEAESGGKRSPRHFGLTSMRERVALVGGWLDIETRPGHGATLFVHVPLPRHG